MAGLPGVGDPPCPNGSTGQADWSILVKKQTLPLSPQQAMSITDSLYPVKGCCTAAVYCSCSKAHFVPSLLLH
jgi:hypothetical protein